MCSKQPSIMLMAEALTPRHCFPNFNYERLETLGDAFLKYDCCTHVYFAYPKAHEGISPLAPLSLRVSLTPASHVDRAQNWVFLSNGWACRALTTCDASVLWASAAAPLQYALHRGSEVWGH